ncbi:MAG: asparagine synthase (glutamine-hydrolyzing) [Verrucomicrobiaceae bacterium]|nr:MAG: asparagine synthase (glutamine-hydrolyzing) [Verrucomicrobiaceae bacterium]
MCGIAGFFDSSLSSGEADARLGAMLQSIHHRGPDGEGRLHDTRLGVHVGMRRLGIIDLTGGDQPIWNETRDVAVIFNGEIYNYREIRQQLQGRGHTFRTSSDTEVLVHLYEEHGDRMIEHLRGMYAFLIIDLKARRGLIARDPFGQKPLYYTTSRDRLAFGSELKALSHLPWVDWEKDPDAYLIYLTWLSLPAPRTHFRHIRKLEPGAILSIPLDQPDQAKLSQPWSYLDLHQSDATTITAEEAEDVLRESVRLHLRSDVPVGIFLSGGLDSKLVSALTAAELETPPQAFTAVFDGVGSEENEAAATARLFHLPHHRIRIRSAGLGDQLAQVVKYLDEPIGDPAAFAVSQLAAAARERVKVVLSGEGSDELFGGYHGRYQGMHETIRTSDKFRKWGRFLPTPRRIPSGRARTLWQRAKFSPQAEIAWMRREGLPGAQGGSSALHPSQQKRILEACEEFGSQLLSNKHEMALLEQLLAWDIRWQLPESLLQKADKMTMRHSLELRAPFLDLEVARLASRVRHEQKLDSANQVGKSILRQVMARLDPTEDPARPKKGFPMPFADWFRTSLRAEIEETLFDPSSAAMERLDKRGLRSAWQTFQQGGPDSDMGAFYALWCYELWNRFTPSHSTSS